MTREQYEKAREKFPKLADEMEKSILQIKKERVNENGEEDWYRAMTEYLHNAPYSKNHNLKGLHGLLEYFRKRLEIEEKVIAVLPKECYLELQSKQYNMEDVLDKL